MPFPFAGWALYPLTVINRSQEYNCVLSLVNPPSDSPKLGTRDPSPFPLPPKVSLERPPPLYPAWVYREAGIRWNLKAEAFDFEGSVSCPTCISYLLD